MSLGRRDDWAKVMIGIKVEDKAGMELRENEE